MFKWFKFFTMPIKPYDDNDGGGNDDGGNDKKGDDDNSVITGGDDGNNKDKGGEYTPPEFLKGTSDDIAKNPYFGRFKTSDEAFKAHLELQKSLSEDKRIPLPGEKATDEERAKFYEKIRGIDDPTKYELKAAEDIVIPEHLKASIGNEEKQTAFKKFAFEIGLRQEQVDKLYNWQLKELVAGADAVKDLIPMSKEQGMAKLKEEFADKLDTTVATVQKVFEKFGDDESRAFFATHGNNPALVRVFAKIGAAMSEDTLHGGGDGDRRLSNTPQAAQEEIDKILANKDDDYYSSDNAKRQARIKYVNSLYETVYRGK